MANSIPKKTKKPVKKRTSSDDDFELLITDLKDWAFIKLDPYGDVITWNSGAHKLTGFDAPEIEGQHFSALFTAEDLQLGAPAKALLVAVNEGRYEKETWLWRKNGTHYSANLVIQPLYDTKSRVTGFASIIHDTTERKDSEYKLQEVKQRLSLALEGGEVGVWDWDLQHDTCWRSLKHDEIFGYSEPVAFWNFAIFLKHVLPEDRERVTAKFKRHSPDGRLEFECRILRADKVKRWVAVRGETSYNDRGASIRMVGTLVDITIRKQQEEVQCISAVIAERDSFIATLTHDMKNPLVGANRLLELLVSGQLGDMEPEHRELLVGLRRSNSNLLELVKDLAEVYRLDKDLESLYLEETDLTNLLQNSAKLVKSFAEPRGIELTTQLETINNMPIDKGRIERLVQNLLDNAMKFAEREGSVGIYLRRDDAHAVIEVINNGPVIPPDEIKQLFKRFSQGAVGRRYAGGSGLGLYLCKQIAEAHGGTIECESKADFNTTFRVRLPLKAASNQP